MEGEKEVVVVFEMVMIMAMLTMTATVTMTRMIDYCLLLESNGMIAAIIYVCVFLVSGYEWVTVMQEIPISSAQMMTSLPYSKTQ